MISKIYMPIIVATIDLLLRRSTFIVLIAYHQGHNQPLLVSNIHYNKVIFEP